MDRIGHTQLLVEDDVLGNLIAACAVDCMREKSTSIVPNDNVVDALSVTTNPLLQRGTASDVLGVVSDQPQILSGTENQLVVGGTARSGLAIHSTTRDQWRIEITVKSKKE